MNHGSGRRRGAGRSRPSPARYSCARSAFAVDLTTEDLADAIVSALPPDAGVSIVAELHDEYPDTPVVAEVPRPKAGLYPGPRGSSRRRSP